MPSTDTPKSGELVPVEVAALVEDQANSSPIVVLHDKLDNRVLPIWIGDYEARAIAIAINKVAMPRPLTHKLLANSISVLGGKLTSVVVDRLLNQTYYASLHVAVGERIVRIDSRPSDAIVLAIEGGVPLFVEKSIMAQASHPNPFKGLSARQEKRKLSEPELKHLAEVLEKARAREQQASE